MRVLGAIIAGGQSRRMGQEKALLMLEGVSLLERTLSRLRIQVDDVVLNANGDPGRFAAAGLTVVADRIVTGTPLSGLHAALAHGAAHGFEAVVTVPSDAPFLPLDLVARLLEAGAEKGAAIAFSGGHSHYLTGVWTTALARPLEKLLVAREVPRVQDFAARVEAETVLWTDMPHDPFFNINTPEDLVAAAAIVRGGT
ncbi:MAG: molybdenum cofactor guanylyltransferase MobA [Hyphomicrobiales bacterium]